MDFTDILNVLRNPRYHFAVNERGEIRARSPVDLDPTHQYCPITALYHEQECEYLNPNNWGFAAHHLHLPHKLAQQIVDAADDGTPDCYEPTLRAQMLAAIGERS